MEFTVTIITDIDSFYGLEKDWNTLLSEVPSATVFQGWEWQSAWIETFSKELFIVMVSEGDKLVAILPFYREKKPFFSLLKLIGSPDSDYLDFLIRKGLEKRVISFFFTDFLKNDPSLGIVELDSIPETSPNRPLIESILQKAGYRIQTREKACPFIELPDSWEEYIQSLTPSTRYFINRKERKLGKQFVINSGYVKTKEELEKRMEDFIQQHQKRWNTRKRSGAFAKERFSVFHKKAASSLFDRGKLRLYYLELDGKPVASYYLFFENNILFFYLSGFEPDYGKNSVSSVLFAEIIWDAISVGIEEFDLMRGEGAYKFKWTNKKRINRSYFIAQKRFPVFVYSMVTSLAVSVAAIIKKNVPYSVKNGIRKLLPKRLVTYFDPYFQ